MYAVPSHQVNRFAATTANALLRVDSSGSDGSVFTLLEIRVHISPLFDQK